MPARLPICCTIIVAFAVCNVRVDAALIDVQTSAKVTAGLIRLSDLAQVDDANPQVQRQLEAVSLGPAPAPGRKLRITQQMIRQRLLAQGINLSEIEFTGQSVVVIEGPAESKSEQKSPSPTRSTAKPIAVRPLPVSPSLRKKADDVLQQAFHRQYHSAGSSVGPLKLTVEIPDDDIPSLLEVKPQRVRFVEPGLEWGGPQTLTAQFSQDDGTTRVVRVQAWLNETPHILTVKHTVPKGKVLKESDLDLVAAKHGESGLETGHELIGQEATRDLRPGQAIHSRDVAKAPLVRSNDLVTVKVRSPGLTVSRVFRATNNGGAGEVVNLVALENPQEKVQATVTGWHEAEMITPTISDAPVALARPGRSVSAPATEQTPGGRK